MVKHSPIIIVFILALILRFVLSPTVFHVDIFSNAGWGEWIHDNGPLGFYQNSKWIYSWPTQPPLVNLTYGFSKEVYVQILEILRQSANIIVKYHLAPGHMIWWFNFVIWFDNPVSTEIWYPLGYLVSIKAFAIIADILIAGVIYWFAKKQNRSPFLWTSVYLFMPFSWYISGLWGQYDQLAYLFVLASFIGLVRFPIISPLLLALSISLKPTSAIFIPLFIWFYWKRRPGILTFVVGIVSAILVTYFTLTAFTTDNVFVFIKEVLIPKIIFKSDFRATTGAYNLWYFIFGETPTSHDKSVLFVPAKVWGLLLYAFINVKTFLLVKKPDYKNILAAMFVVGAGSFISLTNQLERYYFAGVVSGLFVVIAYPKLFKYWILLAIIFCLNLYKSWQYPDLPFLKNLLFENNYLMGRLISLANVILYFKMSKAILNDSRISKRLLPKY